MNDLYPQTEPYRRGYLQVSPQHSIYYAEFGNPNGVPVVTVHGGPGGQSCDFWSSFFDPKFYRVVMFDQRGGGRSVPVAEMNDNTPQRSIEDMETLRTHLKIDRWILFGGSYGSFLSLLYGEAHPDKCLGFVLRGVFLARESDYKYIFYGMKQTYPEKWDEMVETLPLNERGDLISTFYKRVMDPNPAVHLPAARAFMTFNIYCSNLLPDMNEINAVERDTISTLGVARAYIYYSYHSFFVEENQILKNLSKITHLPAIIVHGRYDVICPPQIAYDLYKNWNQSELWFVSDAGHSAAEPGISQGLKNAMDEMKKHVLPVDSKQ